MKKSIFTFAAAALFAAGMTMTSCGGNKTEQAEATNDETTEAVEENAATPEQHDVTVAQLDALQKAGFISNSIDKTIFIDFNATWCGPCRQFAPFFEAAAEKYADRGKFLSVDVDVYGEVAQAFGVQSIPTVIALMPNGKYVVYVGTSELVGEGAFEGIVNKFI